ncbi:DnaJ chaperone protein [Fadolivirus algeromassiliense]|jgi:curved DNA-binding protein CbpA|uniref:DnaJ chaperone protein n=1 Tax=Fadolivirus FV1/VV64 TaxID=3070911 RepID=A0A7D3V8K0_9VIRU|nr:DnaJ chaperone protein [Fadolivirus algeromassiliense]QKF93637.1 DnaJ chaperone protein [Fadolivirus FV1/VV64]
MNNNKDYYKILEVDRLASKDDIKKSYRNLALKWHPDKNKSSDALQKFKDISEAYQVLYNDDKRKEYDNISNQKHQNIHINTMHNPFNFKFTVRDPFEIFNEVFSIITGLHNSIMAFDSMMQFHNTGMTVHIIDMGAGMSDMSDDITNILDTINNKFRHRSNIQIEEVKENITVNKINNHDNNHINKKFTNHSNINDNIITPSINIPQNNKVNDTLLLRDKNISGKWIKNKGNGYCVNMLNDNELNKIISSAFS